MPFGLDFKSFLAGILIAYFVIPYIRGMMLKRSAPPAKPAQ